MIGREVSHYRVVRKLGGGGMGVVYEAEDRRLKRKVALKFLPPEWSRDDAAKQRFLREARAASALDHPNICTLHDIGETADGQLFLAMAYYRGETLKQRLARGMLSEREAAAIGAQIAEGLAAAHERGIVHRDIKPANVILTDSGLVKIVDFGLAKLAGEAGLTRTGSSLGTPAYMSPEQAKGGESDHRSDLWSLGVVLYEMLAGRPPFAGEKLAAVIHAIVSADPRPVASFRGDLDPGLGSLVGRSLAKDPADRPASASEVAVALRRIEAAGDGSAETLELETAGAGGRRRGPRSAWMVAATALVLAAVASGWYWWLQSHERGIEPAAALQPGRAERTMIAVLPFDSLGTAADEALTVGLTVEITSRLSAVENLGVVAYSSAARSAQARRSFSEVGEELGVEHLLLGTVQWGGEQGGRRRVRITPRLVRTHDEMQLWAEVYDEEFDDILRVQSDIAARAIERLAVELTPPERRDLEARPTDRPEAYRAYLVGLRHREVFNNSIPVDEGERATEQLERAVALDPSFAEAWAALSDVRSLLYLLGRDRSRDNLERIRAAVENALRLAPGLPEVHLAQARVLYRIDRDYARALEVLRRVESALANRADAAFFFGTVLRRQGRWQESVAAYREAMRLDPRSDQVPTQLALSYVYLRDYPRALEEAERALALAPDNSNALLAKAQAVFHLSGDAGRAREVLEQVPGSRLAQLARYALLSGEPRLALAYLERIEGDLFDDGFNVWYPVELARARFLEAAGEAEAARDSYRSAAAELEKHLAERPEDPAVHSALGLAYAGLGRRAQAVRHATRATELLPTSKDAVLGPAHEFLLARTLGRLGDADAACAAVARMLSLPGPAGAAWLERDPAFDRVRAAPCFGDALAAAAAPRVAPTGEA